MNFLTDEMIFSLVSSLRGNCALTRLDLSVNSISDKGAAALATLIESKSMKLAYLELESNMIGPEGATSLCDALSSSNSLISLQLRRNVLGDEGVRMIAHMLCQNDSIQELGLASNQITDEGMRLLALGVERNSSLRLLDVASQAEVTEMGATFLVDAVKANPSSSVLIKGLETWGFSPYSFLSVKGEKPVSTENISESIEYVDDWVEENPENGDQNLNQGDDLGAGSFNQMRAPAGFEDRFQHLDITLQSRIASIMSKRKVLKRLPLVADLSSVKPKTIFVLQNDSYPYGSVQGVPVKITGSFQTVLSELNRKIESKSGIRRLFDMFGCEILTEKDLEDQMPVYVSCGESKKPIHKITVCSNSVSPSCRTSKVEAPCAILLLLDHYSQALSLSDSPIRRLYTREGKLVLRPSELQPGSLYVYSLGEPFTKTLTVFDKALDPGKIYLIPNGNSSAEIPLFECDITPAFHLYLKKIETSLKLERQPEALYKLTGEVVDSFESIYKDLPSLILIATFGEVPLPEIKEYASKKLEVQKTSKIVTSPSLEASKPKKIYLVPNDGFPVGGKLDFVLAGKTEEIFYRDITNKLCLSSLARRLFDAATGKEVLSFDALEDQGVYYISMGEQLKARMRLLCRVNGAPSRSCPWSVPFTKNLIVEHIGNIVWNGEREAKKIFSDAGKEIKYLHELQSQKVYFASSVDEFQRTPLDPSQQTQVPFMILENNDKPQALNSPMMMITIPSLLDMITARAARVLGMDHTNAKLYSVSGDLIKDVLRLKDLKDSTVVVSAGEPFIQGEKQSSRATTPTTVRTSRTSTLAMGEKPPPAILLVPNDGNCLKALGVKMRVGKNLVMTCEEATRKLGLKTSVKHLFDLQGKVIQSASELQDGEKYIFSCGELYKPHADHPDYEKRRKAEQAMVTKVAKLVDSPAKRVYICANSTRLDSDFQPVLVSRNLEDFLVECTRVLGLKSRARKLFRISGRSITDYQELREHMLLIVSSGEELYNAWDFYLHEKQSDFSTSTFNTRNQGCLYSPRMLMAEFLDQLAKTLGLEIGRISGLSQDGVPVSNYLSLGTKVQSILVYSEDEPPKREEIQAFQKLSKAESENKQTSTIMIFKYSPGEPISRFGDYTLKNPLDYILSNIKERYRMQVTITGLQLPSGEPVNNIQQLTSKCHVIVMASGPFSLPADKALSQRIEQQAKVERSVVYVYSNGSEVDGTGAAIVVPKTWDQLMDAITTKLGFTTPARLLFLEDGAVIDSLEKIQNQMALIASRGEKFKLSSNIFVRLVNSDAQEAEQFAATHSLVLHNPLRMFMEYVEMKTSLVKSIRRVFFKTGESLKSLSDLADGDHIFVSSGVDFIVSSRVMPPLAKGVLGSHPQNRKEEKGKSVMVFVHANGSLLASDPGVELIVPSAVEMFLSVLQMRLNLSLVPKRIISPDDPTSKLGITDYTILKPGITYDVDTSSTTKRPSSRADANMMLSTKPTANTNATSHRPPPQLIVFRNEGTIDKGGVTIRLPRQYSELLEECGKKLGIASGVRKLFEANGTPIDDDMNKLKARLYALEESKSPLLMVIASSGEPWKIVR
eukprot:TRINITY_DN8475_c0_g1_i1.p1 TRINITY_DN8475_c0_g1~~TRINITY_DN8475_c0_g1_i1.p1  ORF type:complete len:1578 (+),score=343.17 TRINITY_DN8475_c0_g1_i1:333-5066(+)